MKTSTNLYTRPAVKLAVMNDKRDGAECKPAIAKSGLTGVGIENILQILYEIKIKNKNANNFELLLN